MIRYIYGLPILYVLFFVMFSILKTLDKNLDRIIFCSTCFTWGVVLLVGIFWKFDFIIISFMLGMTITGLAYKLQEVKRYNQFITQFSLTMVGLLILFLLSKVI